MTPALPIGRSGLFLDVDGTLLDLAARPDAVEVPPALLESLRSLNRLLEGAVALVSGRSISDLDQLFDPLRLRASGVHGAEMRFDPDGGVETSGQGIVPDGMVAALENIGKQHPGTLVENKRFSIAVHYRAAPSAGEAIRDALEVLMGSDLGRDLRILPGHMVFEIKPATFDKGVAIGRFMQQRPFAGRIPVFLGDDITDRPGFDTVLAQGGIAVSVGTTIPGLSGHFANPADVRAWLAERVLADRA